MATYMLPSFWPWKVGKIKAVIKHCENGDTIAVKNERQFRRTTTMLKEYCPEKQVTVVIHREG